MNFEEFINKYSFVNSKFVKDFFNIIKEDYIERYNEFLIDSEILRKWLQINIKQQFNNTGVEKVIHLKRYFLLI